MLTVVCVWVRGNVVYPAIYVERLRAMVQRHLPRAHRFVCLTDQPEQLPAGVEGLRIAPEPGLFGWWAKVQLFNPAHVAVGRVLYLDLDTLLVGGLDDVINYPAPFALAPHAGTFNGKDGLAVVKRFNSSVMVWDAPAPADVFTRWTSGVARRLWGDQDWIGEIAPHAHAMPAEWFPRLSQCLVDATDQRGPKARWAGVPAEAKVVLCKKPKNDEAARRWPAVEQLWRAA